MGWDWGEGGGRGRVRCREAWCVVMWVEGEVDGLVV